MNQRRNGPQQQPNNPPSKELPAHLIDQFLQNQAAELKNQSQELSSRIKEIESNERLAMASLNHNAQLINKTPKESRLTIITIAIIAASFVLILLGFLGFCVYRGKEQFAMDMFGKIMYGVVGLISYFAGNKQALQTNKESKQTDDNAYTEYSDA